MMLVGAHIASTPNHKSLWMIVTTGLVGFLAESLLVAVGVVRYAAAWPTAVLAPAWIIALWLAFGTTLGAMRAVISGSVLQKSALIGAALGPFSYFGGERLGALVLPGSALLTFIALAAIWGVALPLLLALHQRWAPDAG